MKKNILYVIEPWLEMAYYEDNFRCNYTTNLINFNLAQIASCNMDIQIILSDVHYANLVQKQYDGISFIIIKQEVLLNIFGNYQAYLNPNAKQEEGYLSYLKELLCGNTPDCIYSISTNVDYLRKIYPNILCLYHETGHTVLGHGYYQEPLLADKSSILDKYYDNICKYEYSKSNLEVFASLVKESYNQDGAEFIKDLRSRYTCILVFALENWDSYFTRLYHTKEEILEYILDIIKDIPHGTCIILTQHKRYKFLQPSVIKYLQGIHPGIVIMPPELQTNSILPFSDGVIGCYTTLLINAMLMSKPIFVTSKKSYLVKYSSSEALEDFCLFAQGGIHKRENICGFLLEKYLIPSIDYNNCNIMANYLRRAIEYYQKHGVIDYGFYLNIPMNSISNRVQQESGWRTWFVTRVIKKVWRCMHNIYHKVLTFNQKTQSFSTK